MVDYKRKGMLVYDIYLPDLEVYRKSGRLAQCSVLRVASRLDPYLRDRYRNHALSCCVGSCCYVT